MFLESLYRRGEVRLFGFEYVYRGDGFRVVFYGCVCFLGFRNSGSGLFEVGFMCWVVFVLALWVVFVVVLGRWCSLGWGAVFRFV